MILPSPLYYQFSWVEILIQLLSWCSDSPAISPPGSPGRILFFVLQSYCNSLTSKGVSKDKINTTLTMVTRLLERASPCLVSWCSHRGCDTDFSPMVHTYLGLGPWSQLAKVWVPAPSLTTVTCSIRLCSNGKWGIEWVKVVGLIKSIFCMLYSKAFTRIINVWFLLSSWSQGEKLLQVHSNCQQTERQNGLSFVLHNAIWVIDEYAQVPQVS